MIYFIKQGAKYIRIKLDDILYITADKDHTIIHTQFETFTINRRRMNRVVSKLSKECKDIVRVHRSFGINLSKIDYIDIIKDEISIDHKFFAKGEIPKIPIGVSYRKEVLQDKILII